MVMTIQDESLFDAVVLNLGPLMAAQVLGLAMLVVAYVAH